MTTRRLAAATVGSLLVVRATAMAGTDPRSGPPPASVVHLTAGLTQSSLSGVVEDERGQPVIGALVSALGTTTATVVTGKDGRFEFVALSPGPYSLRAHRSGYVASRPRTVRVANLPATATRIVLQRAGPRILTAGIGMLEQERAREVPPDADADRTASAPDDDHSERAWRVRHARRGVLKDTTLPLDLLLDSGDRFDGSEFGSTIDLLARTLGLPARSASGYFADTPFSGQLNLLTSSSFDTPQQLFSNDTSARNTAYASLAAPVAGHGDWMIRGAITQADISSWTLAGSYVTRPQTPTRHRYSLGMSYSTQRYDGGNPLTLRDLSDGSRNAGEVYAYDEFLVLPGLSVRYGAGYARYDYLTDRNLFSPSVQVTVSPIARTRVSASASRRALAPGAEEFLPPGDTGIWLPPQRTFSSIERRRGLQAQYASTAQIAVERDLGPSTIAVRTFRQHTADQLVTVFGASLPGQPDATLGHYLVGNVGDAEVAGYAASFRTLLAERFRGSIEYSRARGRLTPDAQLRYILMLAPSAIRPASEQIQSVSTAIETHVPETATHVTVLYRLSDGFARPGNSTPDSARPRLDGRFDVQIRQSLPFMSFANARWEMLLAVRNFFRQAGADESIYDELLVLRPPKRVVGGVTLRF